MLKLVLLALVAVSLASAQFARPDVASEPAAVEQAAAVGNTQALDDDRASTAQPTLEGDRSGPSFGNKNNNNNGNGPSSNGGSCHLASGEWAFIMQPGQSVDYDEDSYCATFVGIVYIGPETRGMRCGVDNGDTRCCARGVFYSCVNDDCNWYFMPQYTQFWTSRFFPLFAYVGNEYGIDEMEDKDVNDLRYYNNEGLMVLTSVDANMMLVEAGGAHELEWVEDDLNEDNYYGCNWNGWAYRRSGRLGNNGLEQYGLWGEINPVHGHHESGGGGGGGGDDLRRSAEPHPRAALVEKMMEDDFTSLIPREYFNDDHWKNQTLIKAMKMESHPVFRGHMEKRQSVRSQHSTSRRSERYDQEESHQRKKRGHGKKHAREEPHSRKRSHERNDKLPGTRNAFL